MGDGTAGDGTAGDGAAGPRYASLRALFALGVAAAFLLLTDLESLARHVDGRLLAAVLVAQGPLLLSIVFVAQRHAILLRDPPVPLVLAFKSIVLALGLNLVVPGRLSDLVKAS